MGQWTGEREPVQGVCAGGGAGPGGARGGEEELGGAAESEAACGGGDSGAGGVDTPWYRRKGTPSITRRDGSIAEEVEKIEEGKQTRRQLRLAEERHASKAHLFLLPSSVCSRNSELSSQVPTLAWYCRSRPRDVHGTLSSTLFSTRRRHPVDRLDLLLFTSTFSQYGGILGRHEL